MIIRKKNIGLSSSLFLLLLFNFENFALSKTLEDENLDLLEKVITLVDKEYIDLTNQNELMESAINGMLQSLDPHSVYLPPKEFENLQNNTSGQFGGLGIEVTMENGIIKVISPIDDSPALKAGMVEGDYITHINSEPILGKSLSDAVDLMRGEPKTEITITVVREKNDSAFDLKIIRDIIQIPGVRMQIEGHNKSIGYIRISTFNEKTSEKLFKELYVIENSNEKNIKGYILDLRRNPGGLLKQAIEVTNMFLEEGEIVSTKRPRFKEKIRSFNAKPGDITNGKPLIIIVNGGSASASEIVAGALQDNNRAIIIGTRTFGKGSVQTLYPLNKNNIFFPNSKNLGAIKLTTAEYYTPSGRSIQAEGIIPDFIIEQKSDENNDPEKYKVGETQLNKFIKNNGNEGSESGSSAYIPENEEKDTQLNLAIKILENLLLQIQIS